MGLVVLMAACTSDVVGPVSLEQGGTSEKPFYERPSAPVEGVMSLAPGFDEPYTRGVTRAWTPPTGFELYDVGENKSFSVFFTENPDPVKPYEEEFFFRSSGKWRVSRTDLENKTYYIYGYAPHNYDDNVTATIAKLDGDGKTYADGAVLTLSNLPTATADDVCVIIGAKNGREYYSDVVDYTVPPLVAGDFAYEAELTGEGSGGAGNYVYLLLDHLYASLDISMKVDATYNTLRTIKLKELHLQTSTSLGAVKKKTDVRITLESGANPIKSVIFTPTGDELADLNMAPKEGRVLSTTPQDFFGYFMPAGVNTLVLTSTYDVYDKDTSVNPEGNLVRKDCTATNTLVLSEGFDGISIADRGKKYKVTMKIQPTYLYVMSDPDLNNPTVVIN